MGVPTIAEPRREVSASGRPRPRRPPVWVSFLLRRVGTSVVVLWLAFTLAFLLLYAMPGDAALARLGGDEGGQGAVSPEQLDALRERLGLNDPLWMQYLHRLGAVLTGDLGTSMRNDQPVSEILAAAVPPTLVLAGTALLLAVVVGTAVAVASTLVRLRWLRGLLLSLPALGMGLPTFWVGILFISVFSFGLGWVPAAGNSGLSALVLPAVTLAIVPSAQIAQVLGAGLHTAAGQPYAATTGPAKGASRARVLLLHCARNAAIPALTVAGVVAGNLLAGSVIVETVFSRAGVGRAMLDAVHAVDLTVVQGVVLLGSVIFVAMNLLVDLAYPLLDPRLRTAVRPGGAR